MSASPQIAIVGATGAVGAEMLNCLETSAPAGARVALFASPRSAGKSLSFRGAPSVVHAVSDEAFDGADLALFASSKEVSRQYAPVAQAKGAVVIDNSSAFRMDAATPLVVPEINGALLANKPGLIANPNCNAAIMGMALWPLHQLSPVRRVVASTYQAASGAGAAAMEELTESTRAYLAGQAFTPKVLPHPYAFNVFSHNDKVEVESGYNGEETKVMAELRKIMAAPDMRIGITCVRVPVLRAHAIALSVEFEGVLDLDDARRALATAPGVRVVDDRVRNHFPMPIEASGGDDVLVGRLRPDLSDPNGRTLMLFVSGDQLRKGAALNAVQIAGALLGWHS
jgi:aspartate-semialdehyde dehydrogenase